MKDKIFINIYRTSINVCTLGCFVTCLMGFNTQEKEIMSKRNKDNLVIVQSNKIPLNRPFDINITFSLKNENIEKSKDFHFEAVMPSHGHGMNVKPFIERQNTNYFVVKRLLFHMPGIWQFQLTVYLKDGSKDQFTWEHYLSP